MNVATDLTFASKSDSTNRDGAVLCARQDCHNLVSEAWEESGTLCPKCAIEGDLFDRAGRWERVFPKVN